MISRRLFYFDELIFWSKILGFFWHFFQLENIKRMFALVLYLTMACMYYLWTKTCVQIAFEQTCAPYFQRQNMKKNDFLYFLLILFKILGISPFKWRHRWTSFGNWWLISNVLDTLYRISHRSPRLGDCKCTTLWIKLKHIVETINFMRYSFYHVLPSFSLNLYLFCKNANWQLLHSFTASTSSTLRMAKRFLKINITHFIFEHMFINLWKKIKKRS